MSATPVDPLDGPRWAVSGRVVTMDAANTVLDDAVVYIDRGLIVDVRSRAAAAPAGFAGVAPVASGGTIYPGLIELHNHLCYNALPLWTVPRQFTNRDQWQSNASYVDRVGRPMTLLGSSAQLMAALVRYVEVKLLVAGVTASQGITLSKFKGGAPSFFRGNVRNVEATGEAALPGAHAHIGDIAASGAKAALAEQKRVACYLQHLCEGTDASARKHFTDLRLANGTWALAPAMTGIHSLALQDGDFAVLQQAGGKLVWSPTSNYLLYGATADVATARGHGLPVGLGCDWSPSGSKNLLWELKVARADSAAKGGFLRDIDLVAMATRDAARILGWQGALGSVQAGRRADLMVVAKAGGDPYATLLQATEADVVLTVINGYARYGRAAFVHQVHGAGEAVKVAGQSGALYLKQATADARVAVLSFAAAQSALQDALANFDAVAARLVRAGRARVPAALAAREQRHAGEAWLLAPQELDEMGLLRGPARRRTRVALAAGDLGAAAPYALDALTVADDAGWAARVAAQPNLPPHVRAALTP